MSVPPHTTEEVNATGEKKELTREITTVIRHIRKVYRKLKFRELLRRKGDSKHGTIPDPDRGLEVVYEGVQVSELQRYEVRSSIDLQFRKSGE